MGWKVTINVNYTKILKVMITVKTFFSKKYCHGKFGNWIQGLIISSDELWSLDRKADHKIITLKRVYNKFKALVIALKLVKYSWFMLWPRYHPVWLLTTRSWFRFPILIPWKFRKWIRSRRESTHPG